MGKPRSLDWRMFAGGIDANGRHGYVSETDMGEYHVQPVSGRNGKHRGYMVQFANSKGKLKGGLWQELGMTNRPARGRAICREHYREHVQ